MAMVLYGIALVLLVELLRHAFPDVMQPWYADDSALMGKHSTNAKCLRFLQKAGPWFGYFPEPEKSWHICREDDEDAARAAFAADGLTVRFSRGNWYVGGFVGSESAMQEWLAPLIADWVFGVKQLAAVAATYPQTAYAGLTVSLQAEWQYVCRVVPGVASAMEPVETAIRQHFLPSLFGNHTPIAIDDDFRRLLSHSVRRAGIGIRDPTKVADQLFAAWTEATAILRKLWHLVVPFLWRHTGIK